MSEPVIQDRTEPTSDPERTNRDPGSAMMDTRVGESFDDYTLDAAANVLEHEELNRAMTGQSALHDIAPSSIKSATRLLRRVANAIREINDTQDTPR